MTKLIIDRDQWHRGQGSGQSYLRRTDGKMCCLGFHARQCGYSATEITKLSTPMDVVILFEVREGFEPLVRRIGEEESYINSDQSAELMRLNDETGLEGKTRETAIKDRFAQIGVEVEFIGGDS